MDDRDQIRDQIKDTKDSSRSSVGVSVAIRLRPLNSRERVVGDTGGAWAHDSSRIWTVAAGDQQQQPVHSATASPSTTNNASINTGPGAFGSTTYTFDHIFGQDSVTTDVYNTLAADLVESCMTGVNGTIFAYGQTSSGKTHTMMGDRSEPGIILLAISNVFRYISMNQDNEFLLRVSYLEIYNEIIRDLLDPANVNLKIHETANRDIFVGNLSENVVSSASQVKEYLDIGEGNRHIGETNMNDKSSRSHTIFKMVVESRSRTDKGNSVRVSQLNLVDLAGSERVGHTGAEGIRLKEGGHINKSLLTLSTVIGKLSDGGDKRHIPYRDSKLTRILQPSIGGNANTAIICTITRAYLHSDETHSTLRFASRAKTITNKPHVNEIVSDETLLKRYRREIEELKKQLTKLRTAEPLTCSSSNFSNLPVPRARVSKGSECIDSSTTGRMMGDENMKYADHGSKEKNLICEKLDSLRHAILDASCVTIDDPADRSIKKKSRSVRRQTWFPGVSLKAAATSDTSSDTPIQTWTRDQSFISEAESTEAQDLVCDKSDSQSILAGIADLINGSGCIADISYIPELQPLAEYLASCKLEKSGAISENSRLKTDIQSLQQDVVEMSVENQNSLQQYAQLKELYDTVLKNNQELSEQVTQGMAQLAALEESSGTAVKSLVAEREQNAEIQQELNTLLQKNAMLETCLVESNSQYSGLQEEFLRVQTLNNEAHLQIDLHGQTAHEQCMALDELRQERDIQEQQIDRLKAALRDSLSYKESRDNQHTADVQRLSEEVKMAEARSIKVDEMLNEINEEHQIMEDQHSSDLQRLIQEKEEIEAHTAEVEALLSEANNQHLSCDDQHTADIQRLSEEVKMAEARSIKVDEMLNEINEEHQIMEDQHSSDLQRLIQEKEAIEAHTAEVEALLSEANNQHLSCDDQHTADIQRLSEEVKIAEARSIKVDEMLNEINEEHQIMEDQHSSDLQRLIQEKEAIEAHTAEVEALLSEANNQHLSRDDQHTADIQRLSEEVKIAEARSIKVDEMLNEINEEHQIMSDQHSSDLQRLIQEKEAIEAHTAEVEALLSEANNQHLSRDDQHTADIQRLSEEVKMAEARSIKVDEMLNEINEEHQIMEDQHSSDLQRLIQEKEAIEAHIEEVEALLSEANNQHLSRDDQHTADVQRLSEEVKIAEARSIKVDEMLNEINEEHQIMSDQHSSDLQRLIQEKEAIEAHTAEVEALLSEANNQHLSRDDQHTADIQRLSEEVKIAEARSIKVDEMLNEINEEHQIME
ncbi:hypothetical protein BASA50_001039 [Batrachochytrium salamandrivorans]|uniref:Kinesin motor domain-containing protein n=1 Tax=Batrachochytrium salamandrivorans TaxID=1357716 RepID=A0ABQ8ES64_9FUNG|nr:hypothetical protein BASA50_001039 [Batrachochytrium salamandrivorans]